MYLSFLSDFERFDGKTAIFIPFFRQFDDFSDDKPAPIFPETHFINDGFIWILMSGRSEWASPGALGLAGFGLTTVLLNLHNAGLVEVPLITFCYGFFYGGLAQVIAGIILSLIHI